MNGFEPIALNKLDVQALFNRCLATKDSKETTGSCLYLRALGYEKEDTGISFDKNKILSNKSSIEYLYGQLKAIHMNQNILKMEDFSRSYLGTDWTQLKSSLMQLLYLGSTDSSRLITPFFAKDNSTKLLQPIKPTLSPKDPNFPAWWAQHKSEWETPKKDGQEPADN